MRIDAKIDRVSMTKNEYGQVMNELNQYKKAYQHCVDDLIVLRANNKRLERENGELQEFYRDLRVKCYRYQEAFEVIEDRYTTLTNHIRTKAECNPGVSRYIDLVNFIDRLERD